MGIQITGMALKNLVSKPVTKRYPSKPQVYTERTRGHIENAIGDCILCGICQKKCPAAAIAVNKPARTWNINPFSCVQCNACVRACPPASLTMHPEYTPVAQSMGAFTLTKPEED